MTDEILKMQGITKIYPNGIIANNNVDFSVMSGEIHALMGENGAGKSTLMNILFGIQALEEGEIFLNGKKVTISSPMEAISMGIGMVHQHFMLVPSLTIAENIFLGMEPKKRGLVDMAKATRLTEEIANKYNFKLDPQSRICDIPVGIKQKVEILKALIRGAKILILDEPTAVLTPQETVELFKELQLLKKNGHTIIFISHKLNEVKQICDRITIMKNGRVVGVYNVCDMEEQDISRLMVGRDVISKIEKTPAKPGKQVLKIENLSCRNDEGKEVLSKVSLSVRRGEIAGIAGVEGNGQLELVEIVTGMRKFSAGEVCINGEPIKHKSIRQIRDKGVSHIPEDRMMFGTASDATIEDNLISDKIHERKFNRGILLKYGEIRRFSKKLTNDYTIKCDSTLQTVGMLSGGNMQKVVIAREFSGNPQLLIANQPSRGVDVGATEFIHKKIVELRDNGAAVLLVSADLNEVLELSDSLYVFYGGEIVAYFEDTGTISEEELGYYMLGLKRQSAEDIKERLQHD